MKIRITERRIKAVPAADEELGRGELTEIQVNGINALEEELEEDHTDHHCKGCMGACFGDCGNCRHMKEGAEDE